MLLNVHAYIQVAGAPAVAAHVAFTVEPHLHSAVDAPRDPNLDPALAPFPSSATAIAARGVDHAASSPAPVARRNLCELAEDAALGAPDLAASTAIRAGVYGCAGLVAGS